MHTAGNDLARALKWGGGYTGEKVMQVLLTLEDANVVNLDRWVWLDTGGGGYRYHRKYRTKGIVATNCVDKDREFGSVCVCVVEGFP